MSSFVKRMQRNAKKDRYGIGNRLGVHNEKAKDLVVREGREKKRNSQ